MARKTPAQTATSNNNNGTFAKADAFLRLELEDANGNRHRLPKDVALYLRNQVAAAMIGKAGEDADHEFKLVGTVHVVDNTPRDIAL